jgi:hippurate hydrolase
MNIRNSIHELAEEIAGYRRSLHENPQTAFEEEFASGLVAKKLTGWGIPFEKGIAKTGIVATIEGNKNDSGKSIGLRADMDALDITEKSGQPWASKIPGKMHGCGHDGHTAMLLGAAKYLSENRNFNGTVHLIFQPAEEGERGADKMIEEVLFERFPCDAVFGMHNWPALPKGRIAMRPGPLMAASDTFELTVVGRGGHAALPHLAVDPLVTASQIVLALQTLVSRNVDPVDTAVISVTNFNCGTGADNVIDDKAKLIGTVRTFREETRTMLENRIRELAEGIAGPIGANIEYEYRRVIDPTINEAEQTEFCALTAAEVFDDVITDVDPCMGGEDFGSMLRVVPGCYVWVGQGEPDKQGSPHNKSLHNAGYDFNDSIIPLGIEYWVKLVEKALPL